MMNRLLEKENIVLILLALAPSARLMVPSLNSLVLYLFLPAIFLIICSKDSYILKYTPIRGYFMLMAWLVLSTLFSVDIPNSITCMKTILGGVLASVAMYYYANKRITNIYILVFGYFLLLITTLIYLQQKGSLLLLDLQSERLDDDLVNANDLAYYIFYVIIGITIVVHQAHLSWKISSILYVAILFLIPWLATITASRQLLIVVLPYLFYSIYYTYFKNKKLSSMLIPALVIGAIVYALGVNFIDNSYEGSYLAQRMETKVDDDSRTGLLEDAINVGIANPIFGVGPGNLTHFSRNGGFAHNSYAELFSTSGIISVVIYVFIILLFIKQQKIRYKASNNPIFKYLYISGIAWAAYNMLYVFYSGIWLISFLFMLMGYSNCIYNYEQRNFN